MNRKYRRRYMQRPRPEDIGAGLFYRQIAASYEGATRAAFAAPHLFFFDRSLRRILTLFLRARYDFRKHTGPYATQLFHHMARGDADASETVRAFKALAELAWIGDDRDGSRGAFAIYRFLAQVDDEARAAWGWPGLPFVWDVERT